MTRQKQAGFTFIELILVLAILLILTALSASFYSRYLVQNSVDNAVDQITGSLRKAQIYSMMGKQNSSWSIHYDSAVNILTLYKGTSFVARQAAFDEKFSLNPNIAILGLTSDISYLKITGLPSVTPVPAITVTGGTSSKNITVNNQGVVTR